ncbi:uncharacterized protein K489DRAFT_328047 [Dissoconium aciculare CBS 342.82]|jgi:hypothetical protein|uniref:Uncharacterized protein n=1 Tax=Dissoconium aciculare CBS 342.82 TaxID=1314786 RepID=A0A6J3LQP6_9PEZI|nr:uncharacterized protein K489DRAFT_328047 [Dissoconium aciculare CBS 342.82]KAF1818165.1 hypothetical protein K489DRAFT_328047 [Dissoconium aciculare CBS 342.82]
MAARDEDVKPPTTAIGRARAASASLLNANPPYGMWAATAAVVANAPNVDELRQPVAGGQNLEFDGTRTGIRVQETADGQLLVRDPSGGSLEEEEEDVDEVQTTKAEDEKIPRDELTQAERRLKRRGTSTLHDAKKRKRESLAVALKHGLSMFGKFVITPWGFLITLYGLNIVAWGAMLFFLLLNAAPAMAQPSKDDPYAPRQVWLEIDSQILNALFCVTGFGLAPWRFRDLYYLASARYRRSPDARAHLAEQNKSWFRPPIAWESAQSPDVEAQKGPHHKTYIRPPTYTGNHAPPTRMWKLHFVVWMMVLNSLLQAVLSFFMWHYSRFDRPTWATGTFIALGCGVAMFAGIITYLEGRKVKKIEGPLLIITKEEGVS